MANRQRGEAALEIDGTTYTFVLNTNALVDLQQLFSTRDQITPWEEIVRLAEAGSLAHVRGVIWAALRKYHPEITVEGAGDLIDKAGGIQPLSSAMEVVGESTTPDPKDLDALQAGATGNPPKAQNARTRRTGGRSTATRAVSA